MDKLSDYFPPSEDVETYQAFLEAPGEALGLLLGDVETVEKSNRKGNMNLLMQERMVRRNGKVFTQKFYVKRPEAEKVDPPRAAPVDKDEEEGIKRQEYMFERNPFKQSEDPTAYAAYEMLQMGFKKDEKVTFKKIIRNLTAFVEQFYEGDTGGVTQELAFYLMANGAITGLGSTPENQLYIPFEKKNPFNTSKDPVAFMAWVKLKNSKCTTFAEAEKLLKPLVAGSFDSDVTDIDVATQELICYLIEKGAIKLGREGFSISSDAVYMMPKGFTEKEAFNAKTVLAALLAKSKNPAKEEKDYVTGKVYVPATSILPTDAQKVIRKQFASILAEFGMETRFKTDTYGYKPDKTMDRALAYHDWEGATVMRRSVHEDLIGFCKGVATGSHTRLQRDAARVMIHEELHGHSPMDRHAYNGAGAIVEEVTTEVAARVLMRKKFKFPDFDFMTNEHGSYGGWIKGVINAIADGADITAYEATQMLEQAAIDIKKKHPKDTAHGQYKINNADEFVTYFLSLLPVKATRGKTEAQVRQFISANIHSIRSVP